MLFLRVAKSCMLFLRVSPVVLSYCDMHFVRTVLCAIIFQDTYRTAKCIVCVCLVYGLIFQDNCRTADMHFVCVPYGVLGVLGVCFNF
jgi:hypothetical protein